MTSRFRNFRADATVVSGSSSSSSSSSSAVTTTQTTTLIPSSLPSLSSLLPPLALPVSSSSSSSSSASAASASFIIDLPKAKAFEAPPPNVAQHANRPATYDPTDRHERFKNQMKLKRMLRGPGGVQGVIEQMSAHPRHFFSDISQLDVFIRSLPRPQQSALQGSGQLGQVRSLFSQQMSSMTQLMHPTETTTTTTTTAAVVSASSTSAVSSAASSSSTTDATAKTADTRTRQQKLNARKRAKQKQKKLHKTPPS